MTSNKMEPEIKPIKGPTTNNECLHSFRDIFRMNVRHKYDDKIYLVSAIPKHMDLNTVENGELKRIPVYSGDIYEMSDINMFMKTLYHKLNISEVMRMDGYYNERKERYIPVDIHNRAEIVDPNPVKSVNDDVDKESSSWHSDSSISIDDIINDGAADVPSYSTPTETPSKFYCKVFDFKDEYIEINSWDFDKEIENGKLRYIIKRLDKDKDKIPRRSLVSIYDLHVKLSQYNGPKQIIAFSNPDGYSSNTFRKNRKMLIKSNRVRLDSAIQSKDPLLVDIFKFILNTTDICTGVAKKLYLKKLDKDQVQDKMVTTILQGLQNQPDVYDTIPNAMLKKFSCYSASDAHAISSKRPVRKNLKDWICLCYCCGSINVMGTGYFQHTMGIDHPDDVEPPLEGRTSEFVCGCCLNDLSKRPDNGTFMGWTCEKIFNLQQPKALGSLLDELSVLGYTDAIDLPTNVINSLARNDYTIVNSAFSRYNVNLMRLRGKIESSQIKYLQLFFPNYEFTIKEGIYTNSAMFLAECKLLRDSLLSINRNKKLIDLYGRSCTKHHIDNNVIVIKLPNNKNKSHDHLKHISRENDCLHDLSDCNCLNGREAMICIDNIFNVDVNNLIEKMIQLNIRSMTYSLPTRAINWTKK